MKNILIVSSSFRKNSNSEMLAKRVGAGAREAGHIVTEITLKDKSISFCKGGLSCQSTGKCVLRDDMDFAIETVKNADAIVFATPVYYYGVSGQLKAFLDRCNPLYVSDYRFREVYLVTASAENDDEVYRTTEAGIRGWVDCFPKAEFCRTLSGGGLSNPGEAEYNEGLLLRAYEMGKRI